MTADDRVQQTKNLIDYILGKIPGGALRSVQVEVTWKAQMLRTGDDDEYDEYEIVPSVKLSWGEAKQ